MRMTLSNLTCGFSVALSGFENFDDAPLYYPPLRPKSKLQILHCVYLCYTCFDIRRIFWSNTNACRTYLCIVSTYTLGNSNGSKEWKAVLRTHSKFPRRKILGTYITLFWKFPTKKPCRGERSFCSQVTKNNTPSRIRIWKKEFLLK